MTTEVAKRTPTAASRRPGSLTTRAAGAWATFAQRGSRAVASVVPSLLKPAPSPLLALLDSRVKPFHKPAMKTDSAARLPALRLLHRIRVLAAALLAVAAALVAIAQERAPVDLSGAWILKFTSPNGDKIRLPLTLRHEGDRVTGQLKRPDGNISPLEEGTFQEGEIAFSITQQRNQRTITSKYKGKVEGDQIKGTFESNFGGQTRTIAWEAARKRNDATGVWKWTFVRDDGQPMEFTLRLKQEGSQLTGVSISPSGAETPIADAQAENDELKFKVIRERDDRKFTTAFHGKRSDDNISGKVETDWTGAIKSYDWTAKRVSEDW